MKYPVFLDQRKIGSGSLCWGEVERHVVGGGCLMQQPINSQAADLSRVAAGRQPRRRPLG